MSLDLRKILKYLDNFKYDYDSLKGRFEDIAYNYSENYYGEYTPKRYHRSESFYNVASIKKKKGKIDVGFNINALGHGRNNKYIFEYMYKRGWHGGILDETDDFGNPHPLSSKVPYWVVTEGSKHKWYKPAFRGENGETRFYELEKEFEYCISNWEDDLQNDLKMCEIECRKIYNQKLNELLNIL